MIGPSLRLLALPVVVVAALWAATPAQAAMERARITWETAADIDLHVYDDAGNHAF